MLSHIQTNSMSVRNDYATIPMRETNRMFIRKGVLPRRRRRWRYDRYTHRFCSLSVNDIIRILSSLILPLTLGVFTVFITLHQHLSARQDRHDDLNRFEDQRREDRNETRLQREHEWNIAKMNAQAQNKAAIDRYQDEVLVTYIKEIGDLLKEKNGSLTSDRLTATLARVKTVNILRQVDGSRQIHIIRFLYEARQLNHPDSSLPLDISTIELTNIDFHHSTWSGVIEQMSLMGIYLRNCTFDSMRLIDRVNFTLARFDHVNFTSTILDQVIFSLARFRFANFVFTRMYDLEMRSAMVSDTNFVSTNLTRANLGLTWFKNVNFSSAWISQVNFSSTWFSNVDFSSAILHSVNFSSSEFARISSTFHHAMMTDAHFVQCNCRMADFTSTNLTTTTFFMANLKNVSFRNAILIDVNFSRANLWNADFTNTTMTDQQLLSALSIRNARLPNGTLGRARNLIDHEFIHSRLVKNNNVTAIEQRIDLAKFWDADYWPDSSVELHFYRISGLSIELQALDSNGTVLHRQFSNSNDNQIVMELHKLMRELAVIVKYNAKNKNNHIWCNHLELFINYDILRKISTIYRS